MAADGISSLNKQDNMGTPIMVPKPRRRPLISPELVQQLGFILPLSATCYSALLAALIARGFPGSTALIVMIELALLGGCAIVCFASGLVQQDWPAILLGYGFVVAAIVVSIIVGRPMIETLRAAAIIALFFMLGQRISYQTLDRLFFWTSVIVLFFLVIEIASLQTYATIFQPANFFAATRGMEVSEYNTTGLSNSAAGFASRFSFGLFSGPRTSSIFLEQVSNANFACVETLYLAVRGRELKRSALFIQILTILLILVTANSRFGSMLILVILAGYVLFPKLPRVMLPLASVAIAAGALIVIFHNIDAVGDDIQGRLSYVGRHFRDADLGYFLGTHAVQALADADSGYTYFVGTTTIFGIIMLWLFVNVTPRMNDAPSRRLGWGLIFYFFGQLLVSSTSLLSIKTAALLWVLVGCVRLYGNGTTSGKGSVFRAR
ncbi:hypothetical protein [Sphingomonas sp. BAUL-RG-20F-R05-02]|uniref:hypothetical protein n=1 Tax=Sphingomonas sp. BAUL-RG-20F-R05-02 TaxID=2914830 RepID=UPI001F566225|nr:hypothetical protein [Sphingomonas sp. BAUL-RG-20F-R05-02]